MACVRRRIRWYTCLPVRPHVGTHNVWQLTAVGDEKALINAFNDEKSSHCIQSSTNRTLFKVIKLANALTPLWVYVHECSFDDIPRLRDPYKVDWWLW